MDPEDAAVAVPAQQTFMGLSGFQEKYVLM
jgi:hypothetical protein